MADAVGSCRAIRNSMFYAKAVSMDKYLIVTRNKVTVGLDPKYRKQVCKRPIYNQGAKSKCKGNTRSSVQVSKPRFISPALTLAVERKFVTSSDQVFPLLHMN